VYILELRFRHAAASNLKLHISEIAGLYDSREPGMPIYTIEFKAYIHVQV
jgi:hypothetical protein